MARSYCAHVIALVSLFFSGISVVVKATDGIHYPMPGYTVMPPDNGKGNHWLWPPRQEKYPYPLFKKIPKKPSLLLDCIRPTPKKEDTTATIVQYTATKSIVFDSKKNVLSLHGNSVLDYNDMKLEAEEITLNLTTHTLTAQGTTDQHNQPIGRPIFTYKDVTKDKYGKEGTPTMRTFYMDKIEYNIHTKRALVCRLLTKQTDAIVNSINVKKEDETTFYTRDLKYTTCALEDPHFYIRAKHAKMIQDNQVTSGPFQFYFDDVPTPLGSFFGILFLEGKRKHGVVPGEMIVEEEPHGFGLKEVGYYMSFNDYIDFKILGTIYGDGFRTFTPELRYKRRYQFDGGMRYTQQRQTTVAHSFRWKHTTLAAKNSHQSININIEYYSSSYKKDISNKKDISDVIKQSSSSNKNDSTASVHYQNKIGPYTLSIPLKYENKSYEWIGENIYNPKIGRSKKWVIPEVRLSAYWYPIKGSATAGIPRWCSNIRVQHDVEFMHLLKNLKKKSLNELADEAPSSSFYKETGLKQKVKLGTICKLFEHLNLEPHVTYEGACYGQKQDYTDYMETPIELSGFYHVHKYYLGGALSIDLNATHLFQNPEYVQAFRIRTKPSLGFDYTPDIDRNKQFFYKQQGRAEPRYLFEGYEPAIKLCDRASAELKCSLSNTVELVVKKEMDTDQETDPNKKIKKRQKHTITLLKNVDFSTSIDLKAATNHLKEIRMHIASGEVTMGKMLRLSFDLDTRFDPYLSRYVLHYSKKSSGIKYYEEEKENILGWAQGKYLGQLRNANFQIKLDLDPLDPKDRSREQKNKEKALLSDLTDLFEDKEKPTDFDTQPLWHVDCAFHWNHKKKDHYYEWQKRYTKDLYISLSGNLKLFKWLLNANTVYDFIGKQWKLSDTKLSIQRDLHCFVLKYEIVPKIGDKLAGFKNYKYKLSLAFKANALKALKLPRERTFNTLQKCKSN